MLYCLRSKEVESRVARSENRACVVRVLESLKCAVSASLLYLKGGAYMAVESPTDGPNDVV